MEKVYIVQVEWNTEGVTEFEILGIYKNENDAKERLNKEKRAILFEYGTNDDYKIETDTDTLFEYQENQWDYYYIVSLYSQTLK